MTAADFGTTPELFDTNVLTGTLAANFKTVHGEGTVVRLFVVIPSYGLPYVQRSDVIGSGFPETLNSSALVIGPTGVGLGDNGVLYVADTLDNRIAGIRNALWRITDAGTGFTVSQGRHLNGELGLVIAPNGDILTVNSRERERLVSEVTAPFQGRRSPSAGSTSSGSPPGAGASCSGLAVVPFRDAVYYVDDATNTLNLLHA